MFRLTPVVKNLILINVLVFIAQYLAPTHDFGHCELRGQVIGFNSITDFLALWNAKSDCFKPYQLFTYMFVHSPHDIFHILFNMLVFASFAPILEEFWGQKRFLLFYMVCGIGAGVFNILMDLFLGFGAFDSMVGASGAIYGVMTAFGIIFPNMELRLLFLPFFSFRAKYMVLAMGAISIYYGFSASSNDNTAHLAHLGGIVVAIIMIQIWRSRGTY